MCYFFEIKISSIRVQFVSYIYEKISLLFALYCNQMDLNKLYLYASNNALSEATLALFIEQPLVKLEEFELLLKDDLKELFQEFNLQVSKTVSFSVSKSKISVEDNITGFLINGYEDGKKRWVLQAKPTHPYYSISIHCLLYKGWSDYKEILLEILKKISTLRKGIFTRALSLTYVDQFNWLEEEFPSANLIFKDSKFLPKSIFDSNKPWQFGLEIKHERTYKEKHTLEYLNKIETFIRKVDEANYNIGLIHNTVCEIQEIETIENLLSQKAFNEHLEFAHNNNKKVIKSILKNEVLSKMGININNDA